MPPVALRLSCSWKPAGLSEGSADWAVARCDPPFLHLVSLVFNEIGSALRVFYICCPTKHNRVTCCSAEIDPKNRAEWCLFPFLCTFSLEKENANGVLALKLLMVPKVIWIYTLYYSKTICCMAFAKKTPKKLYYVAIVCHWAGKWSKDR